MQRRVAGKVAQYGKADGVFSAVSTGLVWPRGAWLWGPMPKAVSGLEVDAVRSRKVNGVVFEGNRLFCRLFWLDFIILSVGMTPGCNAV